MRNPLVVGVDGSDASLRALDWTLAEAARRDLPVEVVHASLWEYYERVTPRFGSGRPSEHLFAEHVVASAIERAARLAPGVKVSGRIVGRDPVAALLEEGETAGAVVMGDRGHGEVAAMLLGSTVLTVAARAACPVVVVRGTPAAVAGSRGRITLGVGDPGLNSAAARFAFEEAQVRRAALTALRAWRRPAAAKEAGGMPPEQVGARRVLDEAVRVPSQAYPGVAVDRETPEGRARGFLLEASSDSDLVVVGARHRAGIVGLQLGAVSHTLLHHAECPVAVVPQPEQAPEPGTIVPDAA
jgi:nucleotide-binding universal stress UspA family protein